MIEQRYDLLGREIRSTFANILIEVDVQGFGEAVHKRFLFVPDGEKPSPQGRAITTCRRQKGFHSSKGCPPQIRVFRLEPMQENAERVVMCQTAAVEKRSIEEERRGNAGTLQDRRDNVVHLPETVIKRQVEAGTTQCPCSVQCTDDIPERYWFEVTEKKFQVRCELCDGSEPIQVADMRHQSIAYHVVVRNHKRNPGERAYPFHGNPRRCFRQKVRRHCFNGLTVLQVTVARSNERVP